MEVQIESTNVYSLTPGIMPPDSRSSPDEQGSQPDAAVERNIAVAMQNDIALFHLEQHPLIDIPVHPTANLCPMMDAKGIDKLAADIAQNGLVNPIVMHEGRIVDGRNRYVACLKANVEPRIVEWRDVYSGAMSIFEWVASINSHRRHLKTDQIVMIHVDLREMAVRDEARQRQIEALRRKGELENGGSLNETAAAPMDSSERPTEPGTASKRRKGSGDTRAKLAREVGVSQNKIQQALTVKKADPMLAAEVREGKKSLAKAIKELEARDEDEVQPIDVPRTVTKLMAHIDAVLEKASEADQKAVVSRLMEALAERQ